MKNYLMNLFEIEPGEIEMKDFIYPAIAMVFSLGIVFLTLFI